MHILQVCIALVITALVMAAITALLRTAISAKQVSRLYRLVITLDGEQAHTFVSYSPERLIHKAEEHFKYHQFDDSSPFLRWEGNVAYMRRWAYSIEEDNVL